ncbi:Disease resistance protein RPM1 [Glycine soja]|uniref:Disease resistance protein RPM1 n=1 Tax=Glycine soja TaxID=3848 RepID=A0A0B2NPD7_GLYSO|nr:Disease resistance protein RPM1 [Glycine soja]
MAETAVSLAGQHALSKILEAVKMLRDLPKEVRDITDELESFQDFINDADKMAEAEEDDGRPLLCEAVAFIKTQILLLQSAYKIQDVKSLVRAERDETLKGSLRDPLFIEEDEVVGLDGPRGILKNWLTNGREKRTVISVVGIAGVGKTTLAKQVYDQVRNNFECHALITVSQSFSAEGLLRHMLNELCKEKKEDPPKDVSTIESLTEEVRNRLRNKRYVVLFDDVWNGKFWDHIESAVIDNKNGSRILITTRDEKVAEYCRKSSFVEVHKLEKPLTEEESLKLFCKKAFQYSSDGDCPEELKDISLEIVRKCKGLPLAIVAIGGLLSQKDESLSYDDLPINLRSCLLNFGMYPEDYEVTSDRLIRQWIAEGFVKHETGKTLEEVAHQYLSGLVRRSLVQVSSFRIGGKVRRCRVHDLIHDMILRKVKDTGFCQYIDGRDQSVSRKRIKVFVSIWTGLINLYQEKMKNYLKTWEISKLKKLRHLLSGYIPSIQWKDIGGMTSLQEIPPVTIDDDGVVIREVEKLKQLRKLWVEDFRGKHEKTLCSLINEMPLLEKEACPMGDVNKVSKLDFTVPKPELELE